MSAPFSLEPNLFMSANKPGANLLNVGAFFVGADHLEQINFPKDPAILLSVLSGFADHFEFQVLAPFALEPKL